MGCTVRELDERLGADELVEWVAFYEHEAWGFEAEERRHAQRMANAMNCVPRPRGSKVFKWEEIYSDPWTGPADPFTPEQRAFLEKRKINKTKVKKRGKCR